MSKANEKTASGKIDAYVKALGDWRGKAIAQVRQHALNAVPELEENWKWNCPVWSYRGNVLSAGAFKSHVKVNFFKGASLKDPKGLFNAGFDAKATRAIDIGEKDTLDAKAFKALVKLAVAANGVLHGHAE